jgi:hypothetical protein
MKIYFSKPVDTYFAYQSITLKNGNLFDIHALQNKEASELANYLKELFPNVEITARSTNENYKEVYMKFTDTQDEDYFLLLTSAGIEI